MNILTCPVCAQHLERFDRIYKCAGGHSFDIAKEGYVNLLKSSKPGDNKGDNKEMARSRRDFLNKGFYRPLADKITECAERFSAEGDAVLDICCGEGYYTDCVSKCVNRRFFGFDISKNMVRLAAKRKNGAEFFVANIASIPVATDSVKFAFHLFAPFHSGEFLRILEKGGVIVTAVPGKKHLYGLKEALYDSPYMNDEREPDHGQLKLIDSMKVSYSVTLGNRDDIEALFKMTPYFYHTPSEGMERLSKLNSLTTEIEFVLYAYQAV